MGGSWSFRRNHENSTLESAENIRSRGNDDRNDIETASERHERRIRSGSRYGRNDSSRSDQVADRNDNLVSTPRKLRDGCSSKNNDPVVNDERSKNKSASDKSRTENSCKLPVESSSPRRKRNILSSGAEGYKTRSKSRRSDSLESVKLRKETESDASSNLTCNTADRSDLNRQNDNNILNNDSVGNENPSNYLGKSKKNLNCDDGVNNSPDQRNVVPDRNRDTSFRPGLVLTEYSKRMLRKMQASSKEPCTTSRHLSETSSVDKNVLKPSSKSLPELIEDDAGSFKSVLNVCTVPSNTIIVDARENPEPVTVPEKRVPPLDNVNRPDFNLSTDLSVGRGCNGNETSDSLPGKYTYGNRTTPLKGLSKIETNNFVPSKTIATDENVNEPIVFGDPPSVAAPRPIEDDPSSGVASGAAPEVSSPRSIIRNSDSLQDLLNLSGEKSKGASINCELFSLESIDKFAESPKKSSIRITSLETRAELPPPVSVSIENTDSPLSKRDLNKTDPANVENGEPNADPLNYKTENGGNIYGGEAEAISEDAARFPLDSVSVGEEQVVKIHNGAVEAFTSKKIQIKKKNGKNGVKPFINPISTLWSKTFLTPPNISAVNRPKLSPDDAESTEKCKPDSVSSRIDIAHSLFGSPVKWADSDSIDFLPPGIDKEPSLFEDALSVPVAIEINLKSSSDDTDVKDCNRVSELLVLDENNRKTGLENNGICEKSVSFGDETKIDDDTNAASSKMRCSRYEDTTLGLFEDTLQFVSALSRSKKTVSPIGTPEKATVSNSASENSQPFSSLSINQKTAFKIVGPNEKPINILTPRKKPRIVSPKKASVSGSSPNGADAKSCRISCIDDKAIKSVCNLVSSIKDTHRETYLVISKKPKSSRNLSPKKNDNESNILKTPSPSDGKSSHAKSPTKHNLKRGDKVNSVKKSVHSKTSPKKRNPVNSTKLPPTKGDAIIRTEDAEKSISCENSCGKRLLKNVAAPKKPVRIQLIESLPLIPKSTNCTKVRMSYELKKPSGMNKKTPITGRDSLKIDIDNEKLTEDDLGSDKKEQTDRRDSRYTEVISKSKKDESRESNVAISRVVSCSNVPSASNKPEAISDVNSEIIVARDSCEIDGVASVCNVKTKKINSSVKRIFSTTEINCISKVLDGVVVANLKKAVDAARESSDIDESVLSSDRICPRINSELFHNLCELSDLKIKNSSDNRTEMMSTSIDRSERVDCKSESSVKTVLTSKDKCLEQKVHQSKNESVADTIWSYDLVDRIESGRNLVPEGLKSNPTKHQEDGGNRICLPKYQPFESRKTMRKRSKSPNTKTNHLTCFSDSYFSEKRTRVKHLPYDKGFRYPDLRRNEHSERHNRGSHYRQKLSDRYSFYRKREPSVCSRGRSPPRRYADTKKFRMDENHRDCLQREKEAEVIKGPTRRIEKWDWASTRVIAVSTPKRQCRTDDKLYDRINGISRNNLEWRLIEIDFSKYPEREIRDETSPLVAGARATSSSTDAASPKIISRRKSCRFSSSEVKLESFSSTPKRRCSQDKSSENSVSASLESLSSDKRTPSKHAHFTTNESEPRTNSNNREKHSDRKLIVSSGRGSTVTYRVPAFIKKSGGEAVKTVETAKVKDRFTSLFSPTRCSKTNPGRQFSESDSSDSCRLSDESDWVPNKKRNKRRP